MAGRTSLGTGPDAEGPGKNKADVPTESAVVSPSVPDSTAANPMGIRPTRLTPGSSGLVALLSSQSRSKPAKGDEANKVPVAHTEARAAQPVHRQERSTKSDSPGERPTPAGSAFDALEVTAVGSTTTDAVAGFAAAQADDGKGTTPPSRESANPSHEDMAVPSIREPEGASAPIEFAGTEVTAVDGVAVTEAKTKAKVAVEEGTGKEGTGKEGTGEQGTGKTSPAVRPSRLTPASGALAALLAQTRTRSGRKGAVEVKTTNLTPSTQPSSLPSTRSPTAGPTQPVIPVRAPTSEPQPKKSGFAATLLGLPAPVITPADSFESWGSATPSISTRDNRSAADAASAVRTDESSSNPVRGQRLEPGRTDEGALTDRSRSAIDPDGEAAPFAQRAAFQDAAGDYARDASNERGRSTETINIVKPSRGPAVAVGIAVAAGLAVLAFVLTSSPADKPQAVRPTPAASANRAPPAAEPPSANVPAANLAAVPTPAASNSVTPKLPVALNVRTPPAPSQPNEERSPNAQTKLDSRQATTRRQDLEAAKAEARPVKTVESSAQLEGTKRRTAKNSDSVFEAKKTGSHSRRRFSNAGSATAAESTGGVSAEFKAPPRSKAIAPAAEYDPDAPLPLTGR